MLFVATLHNSVYAFDADAPATPLWTANLGPSVPADQYGSDNGPYMDISPENGILGTPVIDALTNTIYAVAATLENQSYVYRLHALDTGSGKEKFSGPSTITAQVNGTGDSAANGVVPFVPVQHIQRPALMLLKGVVYVSFGSHGDAAPFHGWLLGYSAGNVQNQVSVFNPTPNGEGGSIWQSGRGPTADEAGNIYVVASNGDTDDLSDYADSVIRLNRDATSVADYFTPSDVQVLNDSDEDLGAAGAMYVPGSGLLITGGKEGILYLLSAKALGHANSTDSQVVQRLDTGNPSIYNMALWNRADGPLVYLHTENLPVTAYKLVGNQLSTSPVAQSQNGFAVPYQGMTLSANGTQKGSGVLWVLGAASYPLPSAGILHAYNADDLTEIWNSAMTGSDAVGGYVKFVNPTVANGKVYVPTLDNQLVVFGPKTGTAAAPAVTGIVNAASYAAGPVAPGEIVAVFGQNMGPKDVVVGGFDVTGTMGAQLYGTEVTFNGIPAPLIYTSAGAIAAIVPYELSGSDPVTVQVSYNGVASSTQTIALAAAAPGIFSGDSTGRGPGAILNEDYSLNTLANPAKTGSVVVVYATGGGQTDPLARTGSITDAAAPLASHVSVTLGGQPAEVLYAGNAGGEVAGAVQLNLRVPAGITGQVPVVVTIGGQVSQATVTVSVR